MVQIEGSVYFLTALLLLTLPMKWVFSAVLAATLHELCHLIVLFLCGGKIHGICIGIRGCEITADTMDQWGQFLSILAGPAGSLSLLLFSSIFPRLAVCGLFHGLYNLIPVLPLDGGRILQWILFWFCPERADWILSQVRNLVCIAFLLLSVWMTASGGGWLQLYLSVLWIIRMQRRKIPCKPSQIGVQ